MSDLFDLTGKTALVTGGTRGLGSSMAIALAEAGADIILLQRSATNASTRDTILNLPSSPRKCFIVTCDLSDLPSVRKIIPKLLRYGLNPSVELPPVADDGDPPLEGEPGSESQLEIDGVKGAKFDIPNGTIHIILNAAGVQARHPCHEFPLSAFQTIINTNLTTPFLLSRDLARYWLLPPTTTRIPRTIINITSLLSSQGGFTVPAYSSSKGALTQLTKAMSNELSQHGIRVNAIAPGYCATEMNTALMADQTRSRQIMERIPMGRWGDGRDFAGVVVWLASDLASGYVTGETITLDGGWMAR